MTEELPDGRAAAIVGYVLAVILPLVGFLYGLVLRAVGNRRAWNVVRLAIAVFVAEVLIGFLISTAQAHTTIVSSNPIYQQWVDEAKVPTPNVTLTVIEEACTDLPGGDTAEACTAPGGTIWALGVDRKDFLHEVGHNADYYTLPQWARDRFRLLIHDPREWRADPNGPNEKFASTYARCAITGADFRGEPDLAIRGGGSNYVSGPLYRRLCRLIVAAG